MTQIAVLTDSVATVPAALARDLGIGVVPVTVELDGVVYRDGVDLVPGDFYARMVATKTSPKTSQPAPGAWLEAFQAAASAGAEHVVCLTLSAKLSGTCNSARQAAGLFADDSPWGKDVSVHVIDTRCATITQGWIVIEAARAARAGASLETVLRRVREVSAQANMIVAVDTMGYLARGGHVPKLVSAAAGTLGLKPLIRFKNGDAVLAGVATSVEHASEIMLRRLERQADRVERSTGRRASLHVGVMHAGAPERGFRLLALVAERVAPAGLLLTDFTPVMGAHTGPGLFGVGYFVEA